MKIFELFGSIFVETDKANESMDKTDNKAKGIMATLGGGIKAAAGFGAAIVGGAAVAGGALFTLANKTAETADFIDKLSERTGINREELQRWKYAAEQSGADVGKLEVGIKKLSDSMDGATNGSKANIEAFSKLGISLDDLKNKSQEEIFNEVMNGLAGMEQGAARNALGNDLLGKSYTEMLPLLNAGAEGMGALKNRADELGLVMSEDAVKAGVKFGDTWADLKGAFGAVFTQLGTEVIPMFQSLADWILQYMPQIKETMGIVFEAIRIAVDAVYKVFKDNVLPILIDLFGWVQENMPTIKSVIKTVFQAIWDIVKQVWDIFTNNLLPILKSLYEFIEPTFPLIGKIIETAFKIVVGSVQTVINIFDKVTSAIKTAIEWLKKFNNTPVKDKTPRTGVGVADDGGASGIAGFANGTNYAPGGVAWVGERGPELVKLPRGSQVIPNHKLGKNGGVTFQQGAFAGAIITDDYGVDRLMDRIVDRMSALGVTG